MRPFCAFLVAALCACACSASSTARPKEAARSRRRATRRDAPALAPLIRGGAETSRAEVAGELRGERADLSVQDAVEAYIKEDSMRPVSLFFSFAAIVNALLELGGAGAGAGAPAKPDAAGAKGASSARRAFFTMALRGAVELVSLLSDIGTDWQGREGIAAARRRARTLATSSAAFATVFASIFALTASADKASALPILLVSECMYIASVAGAVGCLCAPKVVRRVVTAIGAGGYGVGAVLLGGPSAWKDAALEERVSVLCNNGGMAVSLPLEAMLLMKLAANALRNPTSAPTALAMANYVNAKVTSPAFQAMRAAAREVLGMYGSAAGAPVRLLKRALGAEDGAEDHAGEGAAAEEEEEENDDEEEEEAGAAGSGVGAGPRGGAGGAEEEDVYVEEAEEAYEEVEDGEYYEYVGEGDADD